MFFGLRKVADNKIDKLREEKAGIRAFVGTGVAQDPVITTEPDDDLEAKIREMINSMLEDIDIEGGEVAGDTVTNINNIFLPDPGSDVNVYKWVSNNATAGRYNCYLQRWVAGAFEDVDDIIVVVDYVTDPAGHAFNAEVFFFQIGKPDTDDIVPVDVLEMSIKKAYVKTTPGATTTLNCWLGVDTTGEEINVACVIYGGGNLNVAIPALVDGMYIWVKRVGATWVNVTPIFATTVIPVIRQAYADEASPASLTISCHLDVDTTGDLINVVCRSSGATLADSIPTLGIGTMITVFQDGATWRSVMNFTGKTEIATILAALLDVCP